MKRSVSLILICALLLALTLYLPIPAIVKGGLALLAPLELGLLAALLLNTPAAGLESALCRLFRRRSGELLPRLLSAVISVACLAAAVMIALFQVRPEVSDCVSGLSELVSRRLPGLLELLDPDADSARLLSGLIAGNVDMTAVLESIAGTPGMGVVVNSVMAAAVSLISGVLTVSLALCVAVYALTERRRLAASASAALELLPGISGHVKGFCRCYRTALGRWLTGSFAFSALFAILLYVLLDVAGFPYAALIAVLAGMLDLVPWFGSGASVAITVCVSLLVSPARSALWCLIFIGLKLADVLIRRRFAVGSTLALCTLAAFAVGLRLFGVAGPIFLIPLVPAIKEFVPSRKKQGG